MRNLQTELGGVTLSDPRARAAAQNAALQAIVSRTILADEARAQGLDKTPEFALRKDAVVDAMLAQSLTSEIASSVPSPATDEAQAFISRSPGQFRSAQDLHGRSDTDGGRRQNPALIEALKPVNSLDDAQAFASTRQHRVPPRDDGHGRAGARS